MATNRSDIILGVQNRTSAELRNVGRDLRAASVEATRAERAFTQMERGIDRIRDSEIRAARASGDYGAALQRIDSELARTAQGTVRYNDLLARQAVVGRQAVDGSRSIASAFNGIQAALGAAGLAIGVQQLVQFGVSAFQSSQQLKGTQASLRVLSGDTTRYNQVLDLARQNQAQYGGTLQENIAQLTGFTVAARRAGVGVAQLNDLSRRLAVLSPEQGAAGASIAINEALSGNATSLVRRFEIPQQLLKGIGDESTTAAQKLAILSDALDKSGVSAEAVAASTTDAQRAVNSAAAAFDQLKTAAGEGAAPGVERVATGLSRLIGLVTQNPQAIAELKAVLGGKGAIDQGTIDATATDIARKDVRGQLAGQTAGGTDYRTLARSSTDFTPQRLDQITEALTRANVAGGDFRTTADRLLQGYRDGSIGAADFANRSLILSDAVRTGTTQISAQRPEIQGLTAATQGATSALGEQLTAAQKAKEGSDQLAGAQSALAQLSQLVASGLLSSADAAAIMKAQYGLAIPETEGLIDAQNRLANARRLAANAVNAAGVQATINGNRAAGRTGRGDSSDATELTTAYQNRADAVKKATESQVLATGTAQQKLALLQRQLAQLPKGTADYIAKQTEVIQAEQAIAAARTRNAKAAATADGKAVRSAEDLRKARFDLLSTEQQIADLKQRVASGRLSEVDRLEATKQIRDLEEKITDEREKQTKSAIDARLAALDDAKQRRIEERELSAARRVLASGATSGDQKAAAADVLQRVELERAKRALEIGDKTREAGGVSAALPNVSAPGRGPVVAPLPGGGSGPVVVALPTGTTAGGDISQQLLDALKQITFTAYIDGTPLAGNLVATLRTGLAGTRAGGIGKQ